MTWGLCPSWVSLFVLAARELRAKLCARVQESRVSTTANEFEVFAPLKEPRVPHRVNRSGALLLQPNPGFPIGQLNLGSPLQRANPGSPLQRRDTGSLLQRSLLQRMNPGSLLQPTNPGLRYSE